MEMCIEKLESEMTPIPGFDPKMYKAHTPSGNVFSYVSGKWLLQDAKGTGDDSQYLMTSLKNQNEDRVPMYLHEIIMSSHMGITKDEWRAMGLEVDHIDNKDTRNNSISNLRLSTSEANKKNSRDRHWNKIRLNMDVARKLREEFKKHKGSKVEWYKSKGEELGVTARSVQNIILGYTYNELV